MRPLPMAVLLCSAAALGGTKFVGGGLKVGATAPLYRPVSDLDDDVSVTQVLYTQADLGFPASSRIVDVAWRKEGLGTSRSPDCDIEMWMKNVPTANAEYAEGSTQTLADAESQAQKVFSATQVALPSTMGFVRFAATENPIAFDYTGGNLELLVVTDCRAVLGDATDRGLFWRYDTVPGRVRVFTSPAAADGASVLKAHVALSAMRPHTRFRFLEPTKKLFVKVANNVLPNGGAFGLAAQHVAVGVPNLFKFVLENGGVDPYVIDSVTFSNLLNGTATTTLVTPVTIPGGGSVDSTVDFQPAAPGTMRFQITWNSVSGNQVNTFTGNANATPAGQPAAALVQPDDSLLALNANATTKVQGGVVLAGEAHPHHMLSQNFGQTVIQALLAVASQSPGVTTVVKTQEPQSNGAQTDVKHEAESTVSSQGGAIFTELKMTVANATLSANVAETVVAQEIEVSLFGGGNIENGSTVMFTPKPTIPGESLYGVAFDVKNVGSADLHLFGHAETGTECTVDGRGSLIFPVLTPMSSDSLYVLVSPTKVMHSFEVVIKNDDNDERTFHWTMVPHYPGAGQLSVKVGEDTLERGGTGDGNRTMTVGLRNAGDGLLSISALVPGTCEECTATVSFTPVDLIPSASTEATVHITGKQYGSYRLQLTAKSNDPKGDFVFFIAGDTGNDGKACNCGSPGAPLLLLLIGVWSRRRRR